MNAQPALARPRKVAPTLFYVTITATDESQAQDHLNVCLFSAKRREARNHFVFESPAEDDEELSVFVFVVYDTEVQIVVEDYLSDCFDMPHLVDAPLFDEDDF